MTHQFKKGDTFTSVPALNNKKLIILEPTVVWDENAGGYCSGYDVKYPLGDGIRDTYGSISEWTLTLLYTKD